MLGPADLIPVVGYLILRGRCRQCAVKISPLYPLVELATAILFLLVFRYFGFSIDFFFQLTLLFLLLAISLIDIEYLIVPNRLVAVGLIAGLIFYLPGLAAYRIVVPQLLIVNNDPLDALLGMLLGSIVILLIFLISRGGMGAGDVKLMAMIGLYVGLRGTAVVILLGFFFGALVGVALIAAGRLTRKDALPFAPFLAQAALVEVLWGARLWNWYINLFR